MGRHTAWQTPVRIACLERMWADYFHTDDIMAALSALPGEPLPSADAVRVFARTRLTVERPLDLLAGLARKARGLEPVEVPPVVAEPEPLKRPRWDDNVRLVPPGTFPARGFSMLRGR